MALAEDAAVAVTVNFMSGDSIVLDLSTEDTVELLVQKVATARDVPPQKLVLVAGTAVLPLHKAALSFGKDFTATIWDSLGVKWRSKLEPSAATWAPLYNFAAAAYKNRLLVIGGMQGDCNWGRVLRQCENHIWATDGKEWERLPVAPWTPRRSPAACVDAQGRLLVIGGVDERASMLCDAWAYKDSKWAQLPDGPWQHKLVDCAVGTKHGALVLAGNELYELGNEWSLLSTMPPGKRATSCSLIGDDLYVGTYDSSVLIYRDGHWFSVKVQSQTNPMYSLVCAGNSADSLFVYLQEAGEHGVGTIYMWGAEELAQNSGISCAPELAREVVPRFDDIREFHSRSFLLPLWEGLGVLTCWGQVMHSQ